MAAGKKTGGRKRGTPNKRTADLIERLERLKCDPIEALARIAKGAEKAGDLDLARRCHADLMPYRYARQKPVDAPVSIDLPVPASSAEALHHQPHDRRQPVVHQPRPPGVHGRAEVAVRTRPSSAG